MPQKLHFESKDFSNLFFFWGGGGGGGGNGKVPNKSIGKLKSQFYPGDSVNCTGAGDLCTVWKTPG